MKEFDYNNLYNLYDHGGHAICSLYINSKYSTFKEEMSNYPNFDLRHYYNILLPKIKEISKTQRVKQTKPHIKQEGFAAFVPLKYSVSEGGPLSEEHLLSLLLYTDFTDLSSAFSATHRGLTSYEPLESIKKRNSKYYFFSKRLRECVQLYGQYYGFAFDKRDLEGPFCM